MHFDVALGGAPGVHTLASSLYSVQSWYDNTGRLPSCAMYCSTCSCTVQELYCSSLVTSTALDYCVLHTTYDWLMTYGRMDRMMYVIERERKLMSLCQVESIDWFPSPNSGDGRREP